MTRFHDRTLALLGASPPPRSADRLLAWGREHAVTIPAAFLEWTTLDDGTLLRKYSGDDHFWFDDPEPVEIAGARRGLRFNTENQNNFDRIVLLDEGEDPPVLFVWCSAAEPRSVQFAQHFSDAVYAQVFDWQYWLDFRDDDPKYREMGYAGEVKLRSSRCLGVLRHRYEQTVTTRFVVEEGFYTEYRFMKSRTQRLTVTVEDANDSTEIRVTGHPLEAVKSLEAELHKTLADDVTMAET